MECWDWPGGGGQASLSAKLFLRRKASKLNTTTIVGPAVSFPHREIKKRIHMIGRKKHLDFDILNTELAPT